MAVLNNTYNLTALGNTTSVVDLIGYANTSTNGIFMNLFVLGVFIIMLFALKRFEFEKALLVSSWITFLISAFLSYAGLLNLLWTVGFLASTIFTAIYVYMNRS